MKSLEFMKKVEFQHPILSMEIKCMKKAKVKVDHQTITLAFFLI